VLPPGLLCTCDFGREICRQCVLVLVHSIYANEQISGCARTPLSLPPVRDFVLSKVIRYLSRNIHQTDGLFFVCAYNIIEKQIVNYNAWDVDMTELEKLSCCWYVYPAPWSIVVVYHMICVWHALCAAAIIQSPSHCLSNDDLLDEIQKQSGEWLVPDQKRWERHAVRPLKNWLDLDIRIKFPAWHQLNGLWQLYKTAWVVDFPKRPHQKC
jgi:hypothetical protein